MMDIIEILNTHKFTVLWSGGKDSTAALLWTIDNVNHEDWNILYVEVTGNTSPLCNRYVHETAETLKVSDRLMHVKSENDFFDLIKKNGVPTPTSRWCLRLMKLEPMKKYSHHIQVTGMKRTDSKARKNIQPVYRSKNTDNLLINPIREWSDRTVLRYIKKHGIPLNPCYSLYGHSGNCMLCPFHDKRAVLLTMQDPFWRRKVIEASNHVYGRISKEKMETWIRMSSQKTLRRFL